MRRLGVDMDFRFHAEACGIDMVGREAVPIVDACNRIVALDVNHPETMEMVIPAGFRMGVAEVDWMQSVGMDYVVVEA